MSASPLARRRRADTTSACSVRSVARRDDHATNTHTLLGGEHRKCALSLMHHCSGTRHGASPSFASGPARTSSSSPQQIKPLIRPHLARGTRWRRPRRARTQREPDDRARTAAAGSAVLLSLGAAPPLAGAPPPPSFRGVGLGCSALLTTARAGHARRGRCRCLPPPLARSVHPTLRLSDFCGNLPIMCSR